MEEDDPCFECYVSPVLRPGEKSGLVWPCASCCWNRSHGWASPIDGHVPAFRVSRRGCRNRDARRRLSGPRRHREFLRLPRGGVRLPRGEGCIPRRGRSSIVAPIDTCIVVPYVLAFGQLSNTQRWNRTERASSVAQLVNMTNPNNDRYRKLNLTNTTRPDRPNASFASMAMSRSYLSPSCG
jgi:hypothetical protein